MKLNTKELNKLIDNNFDGNIAKFARNIGLNRSTTFKAIHNKSAGSKFAGHLIAFCDKNQLDFREYIFLPNNVKKINQKLIKVS
jgi:hypothetical protein